MKTSLGIASIAALSLLSLSASRPAAAQTAAGGDYRFILEREDPVKYLAFDAQADAKGTATGSLTFTDAASIPDVDDPEDPGEVVSPPELYVKVAIDSLVVEKNQALMNGTVVDSSHRTYIGKWVQLVVEDNAASRELPDRLVWTFCKPQSVGWVPSDAERTDDDGAYLSWWATDAERRDDVGIPSPSLLAHEDRSCRIYPLAVYAFADVLQWEGDLFVLP